MSLLDRMHLVSCAVQTQPNADKILPVLHRHGTGTMQEQRKRCLFEVRQKMTQ